MVLHHFASDIDPAEAAAHIGEHGYAIVDDLADDLVMDRLLDEAMPYIEASAAGRDDYDGFHTRRTSALVARCPTARSLIINPAQRISSPFCFSSNQN